MRLVLNILCAAEEIVGVEQAEAMRAGGPVYC